MEYDLDYFNKKDKKDNTSRECGSCTKCCEGYLSGNIKGHVMDLGKPCFFVEIGKGCTIYNDRPYDPCKKFLCTWITLKDMPEEFKPEKTGVIFCWRSTEKNLQYLQIHRAPNNPSPQVLTWAFMYVVQNGVNLLWDVDNRFYYFGNDIFCSEMKPLYG